MDANKFLEALKLQLKARSMKELAYYLGMDKEPLFRARKTGKIGYSLLCHASEATNLSVKQLKELV